MQTVRNDVENTAPTGTKVCREGANSWWAVASARPRRSGYKSHSVLGVASCVASFLPFTVAQGYVNVTVGGSRWRQAKRRDGPL